MLQRSNYFMASLIVLTMAMAACSESRNTGEFPASAEVDQTPGIIGGKAIPAGQGEFNSVVAIQTPGGDICTGSLIGDNLVLTAGHCIEAGGAGTKITFGKDVDLSEESRDVDRGIKHANYKENADTDQNDIGLLHFQGEVPEGFGPAKLVTDSDGVRAGVTLTLAGYGVSSAKHGGSGDGILRKTQVKISNAHIGSTEFSVDESHGKGACEGDSGGPAYIERDGHLYLLGIVSRGESDTDVDLCNQEEVYTNVFSQRQWIREKSIELTK